MFFNPQKWISISAVKLPRFSEAHDLQRIDSPSNGPDRRLVTGSRFWRL
jgi:hypothetical protein